MQNNKQSSILKTYLVVFTVCLICSFLVSVTAVKLSHRQKENQRMEKIKNILIVADLYQKDADMDAIYQKKIEKQWIALKTGVAVNQSTAKFEKFSFNALARHAKYGGSIPAKLDIANIKRRPIFMPVYLLKTGETLQKIILPVVGKGLWSTMYGFLALNSDAKTISGITFYQHGETPGLGGEISNPNWQKNWQGKRAFDENGKVAIRVIKGEVNPNKPDANYHVDGLSGATITSRGVNDLVNYWLGKHGYGPFLLRLQREDHV